VDVVGGLGAVTLKSMGSNSVVRLQSKSRSRGKRGINELLSPLLTQIINLSQTPGADDCVCEVIDNYALPTAGDEYLLKKRAEAPSNFRT